MCLIAGALVSRFLDQRLGLCVSKAVVMVQKCVSWYVSFEKQNIPSMDKNVLKKSLHEKA